MSCFLSSHKTLLSVALSASLLAGMTSCQDEDFGYSADQIKYNKSFTDIYGKIPADKSWDLSSFAKRSNGTSETRATRAGDCTLDLNVEYSIGDWWEVPSQTLSWLDRALIEGHDNTYLGSNFVLKLPQNDFAIIPIYQGRSSIHSELEIKINGYEIKSIWNKSDNILVNDHSLDEAASKNLALPQNGGTIKSSASETGNYWHEIGYYIGWASGENPKTIHSGKTVEELKAMEVAYECDKYPSYTDEAHRVLTKPIVFDHSKIGNSDGGYMYLSLHNTGKAWAHWENGYSDRWDKNNQSTTIGHRLTSINQNNYMLALNVTGDAKPTAEQLSSIGLGNNRSANPPQVLMIACEDANGPDSDMDINDVVFLIVGYPDVPTVVPTKEVIEKRYMCEDLGGTFDYDFNDIVVDLKQVQEYEIVATPTEINDPTASDNITITEMRKKGCPVQTAKVSHLCGTIPLQIQVGDYLFPKITDPTDMSQTRVDLAGSGYTLKGTTCPNPNCTRTRAHGDALLENGDAKGWNPNEERIIPNHSWDPDQNNITIWADWGYRSGDWHEVTANWENKHQSNPFPSDSQDFADYANGAKVPVSFPENGQAPYIIAFDPSIPWMEEGKRIPEDWLKGNNLWVKNPATGSDRENIDKVGNSFYMENYPAADGEGCIWKDNLTGLAYGTGVSIKRGTAEFAAYEEAHDHSYYVMHIYTQKAKSGEASRIALYQADTWNPNDKDDHGNPLLTTDPDDYFAQALTSRVHATYNGEVGSDFECTTIYLTEDQRSAIESNGVAVVSCTDGLVIRKITMARPCLYDNTNEVRRDANNGVLVDPGFRVIINTNSYSTGRVIADYSERSNGIAPFKEATFVSGTKVNLTAIAPKGYKLSRWEGALDTQKTDNPIELSHTASSPSDNYVFQLYPVWAQAVDPELMFSNNAKEITLTLAINGAAVKPYQLTATSLNMTTVLRTFGVNNSLIDVAPSINNGNHVLSITPKAVGETEFIVYQPDGTHNNTGYGVSDELKVKVKVVDLLPDVSSRPSLGAWAIYEWSGVGADAHIISKPAAASSFEEESQRGNVWVRYNTPVTTNGNDQILAGNAWSHHSRYIDLPHANWLVAEVNSGSPDFNFNKTKGEATYQGDAITINANSKDYCYVVDNSASGKKTYVIDLAKLRANYGHVHLVSVSAPWQQTANVAWIKADNDYSEIRAEWSTLNEQRTSKSLVDLDASDLYHWSGLDANATVSDQNGTYLWKQNEEITTGGQVIYGQEWSGYDYYADLSSATILVVTANANNTDDRVLFQFNKTENDLAKAQVIRASDREYCIVVHAGSTMYYVLDLDKLRDKFQTNYLHLNAINNDWGGKAQITNIQVDSKESSAVSAWKGSQKQNPNASVSSTSITLDGSATIELKYKSNNNGVWPTLSDPNGLIEVLNGENHNGALDGEYIKFVIRGKKAGSGKITISQDANDTYSAASVEVDVNVTCPGYGYRVTLGDIPNWVTNKNARENETWYYSALNDVMSLIGNTDLNKGVRFTFHVPGYGMTEFNIGSNQGDTGMRKLLYGSSSSQNGATWDSGSRKLTYTMSSAELKEYFQGTSSFFVGGIIDKEHLTVHLYVEAVE